MKLANYLKVVMLLAVVGGLSSCEKYYDELENSDEKLCSKVWMDSFETNEGRLCTQTLIFNMNGHGEETRQYQTWNNITGKWNENFINPERASFTWSWMDSTLETLIMNYSGKEVYFDNVWVREHYLSGKIGADIVVFTDSEIF